jgi:hypothetical protein
MSKSKKTLIKGGHIFDSKTRNQFTSLRDALANETKCGCGINCNSGYVSLPNFNSESGDKDGFYGLYVSNGELVVDTIGNVKNTINDFCNGGGSTPPPIQALRLTFDSIENANLLVGDASSVSDWNTFFDLPTYGNPFTSVEVVGNEVRLFGGSEIVIKEGLFDRPDGLGESLLEVNDQIGCIIELEYSAFGDSDYNGCYNLTYVNLPNVTVAGGYAFGTAGYLSEILIINLPQLITAGNICFSGCYSINVLNFPLLTTAGLACFNGIESLTTINLPSCTNLGGTVGDDNVFQGITGNTITATFNSALATNNSGNPDGDIDYLDSNNTVTITYV